MMSWMPEESWTPNSWRQHPIAQQPAYDDPEAVRAVVDKISSFPPLVFSGEIETLKRSIALAGEGRAFLLHGGACAERFTDCDRHRIVKQLKILLQMSLVLTHALRRPVVRIGRIAGQFAKPRSSDVETIDGLCLPSYRGDIVNDLPFTSEARRPDPERMLTAYMYCAATLNFIRALLDGGFADLHHPEQWQLDWMGASPHRERFQAVADRIHDAIDFFESMGSSAGDFLKRVEFYTSHEGLLLDYESAFTSQPPRRPTHYNLGAHYLWIGDRTRQLDGAHVEYFRGVSNPIGIKVGPTCPPDELLQLIERLNPSDEPGRITLITRYGAQGIAAHLPQHIRAVQRAGLRVTWSSDPMHGNGVKTKGGIKTRSFDAILDELRAAFEIHAAEGTALGGVHFELTGENVTECIGGAEGLDEADLSRNYETGCDPRLNCLQSLEMAFLIADLAK